MCILKGHLTSGSTTNMIKVLPVRTHMLHRMSLLLCIVKYNEPVTLLELGILSDNGMKIGTC